MGPADKTGQLPTPPPQGTQLSACHLIVTLSSPTCRVKVPPGVPALLAGCPAHRDTAPVCGPPLTPQKQARSWEDSRDAGRGHEAARDTPIKQCQRPCGGWRHVGDGVLSVCL